MGFRFRKSINLGGFRINISKSGVGYSFGTKGCRFTKRANGGTKTTFYVPETGLSYSMGSSKKLKTSTQSELNPTEIIDERDEAVFENIESNKNEFIDELNFAERKNRMLNVIRLIFAFMTFLGVSLLASGLSDQIIELAVTGLVFAVTGPCCVLIVPKNMKIDFLAEFEDDEQGALYGWFIEKAKELRTSFELYCDKDGRRVELQDLKRGPLNKVLDGVADVFSIYLENLYLYFMPNMLIIYQDKSWAGIEYGDILIRSTDIEKSICNCVPWLNDTEILRSNYRFTNKDGSRNRRYKIENNPLINVCAYEKINVFSHFGLDVNFISSSRCKSQAFTVAAQEFIYSFVG